MGSQQSQQIKAEADRKVTVITAQAQQQSEQIRGEGDGERNRIFAEAYGADPEFFAFYRSMQAYQNAFKDGQTRALVSPKSDFFRYFSTPTPAPQRHAACGCDRADGQGGLTCATSAPRSGSSSPSKGMLMAGFTERCASAWRPPPAKTRTGCAGSASAPRFSA